MANKIRVYFKNISLRSLRRLLRSLRLERFANFCNRKERKEFLKDRKVIFQTAFRIKNQECKIIPAKSENVNLNLRARVDRKARLSPFANGV
jgi:hypothetical protein